MGTNQPTAESSTSAVGYLADKNVLTLATASSQGLPHAAMFHYVNEELTFYIWTRPDTLTLRHIDANPAVSLTVGEYAADWRATKGVQVSGEARVLLDPSEIGRVAGLFAAKFPGMVPDPPTNLSFVRIRPRQAHFIDNEQAGVEAGHGTEFHRSLVYSVFGELPERTADTLAGYLTRVTVPAGEVVVRQGAPADKFFIIVEGAVEVIREDEGETRVVATLTPGQFFGEVAILRDTPRTATVRTVADTTLLTMNRDTFRLLVAQSLGTTQNFDDIVRARMETLDQ